MPPPRPRKTRVLRKRRRVVMLQDLTHTEGMPPGTFFTNQFLIAMPALADPNFSHTVTYICEHTPDGALGIVINRALDLDLAVVLEHMKITPSAPNIGGHPVFLGGPVQTERGFVLHSPLGEWNSSVRVTDSMAVTTSRDILEAMAEGRGPEKVLVALGYAGWGPGQLEVEMAQNSWLNSPADPTIMFDTPIEKRWEAAAALMGVDLRLLSSSVGHA